MKIILDIQNKKDIDLARNMINYYLADGVKGGSSIIIFSGRKGIIKETKKGNITCRIYD
ncbi:hypothetical protein [Xenorhabdus stockiae]|uniref:hypothetical protein n=1 Tax=Xenorhabdus stockiae TaxID=351614 RepID=UPI001474A59B|nr:hypothetical protein [Xenorhabdus stockiae]